METPLAITAPLGALGGAEDAAALEVAAVEGGGMLPPLVRTSLPIELACTSMKVSSGPATIALLCRSTALPFRGWLSDVIQMAVTPLIPEGTTHWSIGRLIEKGRPPVIIWQLKPCRRGASVHA